MTTTAFRIDLMELAIGMKLFTSHRRIPTTIRATRIGSNGMFLLPFYVSGRRCFLLLARLRVLASSRIGEPRAWNAPKWGVRPWYKQVKAESQSASEIFAWRRSRQSEETRRC